MPENNLSRRTNNLFACTARLKIRARRPQHLLDGLGVRVDLQPLRLNETTVQVEEHGTNNSGLFISMRQ
jgi:hypothetical protein